MSTAHHVPLAMDDSDSPPLPGESRDSALKWRSSAVGRWIPCLGRTPENQKSRRYYENFLVFTVFFCFLHATADCVLAFSTAELGMEYGSNGALLINAFYTISTFLLAKPFLLRYGAKNATAIGLLGLLIFVFCFFVAVFIGNETAAEEKLGGLIFELGAAVGGVGAGLLWTGQGSYFTCNAIEYGKALHIEKESLLSTAATDHADADADMSGTSSLGSIGSDRDAAVAAAAAIAVKYKVKEERRIDNAISKFAGLFAVAYLLFETTFKGVITLVFLSKEKEGEEDDGSWKRLIFGIYACIGVLSWLFFLKFVVNFSALDARSEADGGSGSDVAADLADIYHESSNNEQQQKQQQPLAAGSGGELWPTVVKQCTSVAHLVYSCRKLQLLLPYQFAFGFGVAYVNAYMNGTFIAGYLGDGYIGSLSALITVTAAIISLCYARGAIVYKNGAYYAMMVGGAAFLYTGLSVLVTTSDTVGTWNFLGVFYCIYGFARGAWESTNKAILALYFKDKPELKDAGFAAAYFAAGFSGCLGYGFFRYCHKSVISTICTVVPFIAMVSFHYSYKSHAVDTMRSAAAMAKSTTSSFNSGAFSSRDTAGGSGALSRLSDISGSGGSSGSSGNGSGINPLTEQLNTNSI